MLEESGRVDERATELAEEGEARKNATSFLERVVAAGTTGRLEVLAKEHPVAEVRRKLRALLPEEAAS